MSSVWPYGEVVSVYSIPKFLSLVEGWEEMFPGLAALPPWIQKH